jgi:hypothetical protein
MPCALQFGLTGEGRRGKREEVLAQGSGEVRPARDWGKFSRSP